MRLEQAEFTADHYAWGWSFVHYLLENKKYAQKFKNFYVALAREKTIKTSRHPGYGSAAPTADGRARRDDPGASCSIWASRT